jgi:hypothetical protein
VPRRETSEVLHVTPSDEFVATVMREADRLLVGQPADE